MHLHHRRRENERELLLCWHCCCMCCACMSEREIPVDSSFQYCIGDVVEVVDADSSFSIASAEACEESFEKVKCFSGQAWEAEFLRVADYEMSSSSVIGSIDES